MYLKIKDERVGAFVFIFTQLKIAFLCDWSQRVKDRASKLVEAGFLFATISAPVLEYHRGPYPVGTRKLLYQNLKPAAYLI
jgi:hypothetical protein